MNERASRGCLAFVGTVGRHGVKYVAHGRDPCVSEDVFAAETSGVAAPVPALMVLVSHVGRKEAEGSLPQYLKSLHGVIPDYFELLSRKALGL